MRTRHRATPIVAVLLAGLLVGCTAVNDSAAPTKPETPPTPSTAVPSKTSSPAPTSPDPRKEQYDAETASWPDPMPPGYSFPEWDELPHTWGSYGVIPLDNATQVYRCILISAAWYAYFEDDDAVASKDYAVRADEYVIPDNTSSLPVTEGGVIMDENLATMSGICQGISGPLP